MNAHTKTALVIGAILAVIVILTSTTYAVVRHMTFAPMSKEEYAERIQQQKASPVLSGFLVESVPFLSKANRIGLQRGDIIIKYDSLPVTNVRTYYAAIDHILADKAASITITAMRAGEPIQLTAPPGLLGFVGQNWTPFIDTIVDHIRSDRLNQAISLLEGTDAATLSEEQLLLGRILVLSDKDSTRDKEREELVDRILPLASDTDYGVWGGYCTDARRYKTAQRFLLRAVEAIPEDISARLNLASAYQQALQFDEAGRFVDDIVKNHSSEMTDDDWYYVLRVRGNVYESRNDHAAAAADLRKAIEIESAAHKNETHIRIRYLLALARMNNLEQFEEGVAFCDKHPTKSYSVRRYDVDALRAYLLVRNGDENRAQAAVAKWRNDAEAHKWFNYYWAEVHDASDVVDTWDRLTK